MSGTPHIRVISELPEGGVPYETEEFLAWLGGPSWLCIPGRDSSRMRLIVTLLHGNEPSGLRAAHAWLRSRREPMVDTVIYFGSVQAALRPPGFSFRSLPGERDANRVFGTPIDDVQGQIAAEFLQLFARRPCEALIDIHNNTGRNPAYGIGYGVDSPRLNLTALFADWYMNMNLRLETLVEATDKRCPSVSIECGRAGDAAADAVALAGMERFLHIDDLRLDATPPAHLQVLHEPVRVHLRPEVSVAFSSSAQPGVDFTLRDDLDRHNFERLAAGVPLGWLGAPEIWPLVASPAQGAENSRELFDVVGTELVTRRAMIPVMLTTDSRVARSDCLFYAMAQPER